MRTTSIYIHIPFCDQKCDYCSFFVVAGPQSVDREALMDQYVASLLKEIDRYRERYEGLTIPTLYFGGGTPALLGYGRLCQIIDHIVATCDTSSLEELSIELNPNPFDEVLDLVQQLGRKYTMMYRLRFSFGIQTLDDELLKLSGRQYFFNNLRWFLRSLQKIKQHNMVYNFDMIAFGKEENLTDPMRVRDEVRWSFFSGWIASQMADSFSVYTLELQAGSKRHQLSNGGVVHTLPGLKLDDDRIAIEFQRLTDVILDAGYQRYEVSNFSLPSKQSLHNRVYRNHDLYLGIGASAAGLVKGHPTDQQSDSGLYRYHNTTSIRNYIQWSWIDPVSVEVLSDSDQLTEQFFLKLRRSSGLHPLSEYVVLLVDDYLERLEDLTEQWLVVYEDDTLRLTHTGMNVAHTIITLLTK